MAAWIAGIVLAAVMLRRGATRAEKLLLAGCSLMFAHSLINPFVQGFIKLWVMARDSGSASIAQTIGWFNLPLMLISIGGIVCLGLAFWLKFWKNVRAAA